VARTQHSAGQVLIVDLAAIMRDPPARGIRVGRAGHGIGQAERATPAIVALCVRRPDRVILDIEMPEGDGVAVLRAAKRLERAPPAPVVMVLTKGADAYHRLRREPRVPSSVSTSRSSSRRSRASCDV
jgi:DNA-binding NarL/FixJ family response regulator